MVWIFLKFFQSNQLHIFFPNWQSPFAFHLGFVRPLQDVALHQCLPLSSVYCFPVPVGNTLIYAMMLVRCWTGLLLSWLSVCLVLAKLNIGNYLQPFQPKCCIYYRRHWWLCGLFFKWSWLWLWVTRSAQRKTCLGYFFAQCSIYHHENWFDFEAKSF